MKRLLRAACTTLVVLLLWSYHAVSLPVASPAGLSADELLAFAEQLMREGEYFRAITEYRRFLFYYPHDARRPRVHFRIGLAFYRGESYAEAFRTFREVTRRYPETPYGKQAWLWQGETLLRQKEYAAAEQLYTQIIRRFPDAPLQQYAHYQRGWSLLYRRQWRQASRAFRLVPPESALSGPASQLAEEVLDGERLPRKSPLLAGLLSTVVPGGGQLYNGRLGDALLAFFLNGLFGAGIVQAVAHGELAIAGILSFFEAGWYTGNVYGAINGAHKSNRHTAETFLRNLENRYRLLPPEEALSLRLPFHGLRLSWSF